MIRKMKRAAQRVASNGVVKKVVGVGGAALGVAVSAHAQSAPPDTTVITSGLSTLWSGAATIGLGAIALGTAVAFVLKGLYLKKR